jgi:hypothetical protein
VQVRRAFVGVEKRSCRLMESTPFAAGGAPPDGDGKGMVSRIVEKNSRHRQLANSGPYLSQSLPGISTIPLTMKHT